MTPPCTGNVSFETLVAYWCDHGSAADEALDALEALEEHVFGCAACTARLAWIADVAAAVPAVLERRGGRRLVLTADALAHLERRGVRVRHYHFDDSRQIACTVALDDDFLVSWIPIALADDEELAGVMAAPDGREVYRFHDAPVDRTRGLLLLATSAESVMHLPDIQLRLRLSATGPRGLRDLGEYIYNHTAPVTR